MTPERRAAALLAVAMLGWVGLTWAIQGSHAAYHNESGAVEHATAVALLAVALGLVLRWRQLGRFGFLPVIVALFGLREFDFHNWFYNPGFLQLRIFQSDAPLMLKLFSATSMLAIVAVFALLIRRGTGPFLRALRARAPWALLLLAALVLAALSVLLDGPDRTAAAMGITLQPWVGNLLGVTEEALELAFALILAWSAALALEVRRR